MPKPATIYSFENMPADAPMPLITRKRIIADNLMISRVHLEQGFAVPVHHHANEQIAVVVSGRIRFDLPEGTAASPDATTATLTAGQCIVFPSDCPHGAEALQDTLILDIFSPPSETTGVDEPASN